MSNKLSRREWLVKMPLAIAVGSLLPAIGQGTPQSTPRMGNLHDEYPSHDPEVVREVVGAAHGRFERLKELIILQPALAKSAWDWGFGDWESALGAASHMGRRDIAEFLIQYGARPNLFTFAMMGQLEVVKACVEANPGVQQIHGPHGITLLAHAEKGGKDAKKVVEYLQKAGDADIAAISLEVTAEEQQIYLGEYTFGKGPDDRFTVLTNSRGKLMIRRGNRFGRVLNRVEDHGFAPGGASTVRVRFKVVDDRAISLSIHDPNPQVVALRRQGDELTTPR